MKIYVAEGYTNIRKLLVEMLTHEGHDVVATENGDALLAMIIETQPDAVIADARLAGLSALDVVTELRQAEIRVPFVITTLDPPDELELATDGLGGVSVLQKPFTLEALQRALRLAAGESSESS